MGTSKNKIAKKCERNTFWKKVMYILHFKSYELECQIIIIDKPRISVAFKLFRISSIISVIFCMCNFEVSTFGGSLFSGGSLLSGFANTCDILSLLSEVRHFRGVVTFGTLRYRLNETPECCIYT